MSSVTSRGGNPLANSHALPVSLGRRTVVSRSGVPQDKVAGLHLGLDPLAPSILELVERLTGPVKQVALDPAALRLGVSENGWKDSPECAR